MRTSSLLIIQHLSNQLCHGCHVTKVGDLAVVAGQNSCLSATAQFSLLRPSAWSVLEHFGLVRLGVVGLILDYFGVLLLGVVTVLYTLVCFSQRGPSQRGSSRRDFHQRDRSLRTVFHGEVITASHPPQRICSQFFWICLCSDHLSAASQSRSAILSVICSTRSSSVFLRSLDLHGKVVSCFVMVVGAMVRSASAIGSLTCGSFQPGSLQRNRLPWRVPLGFSTFFVSRPGSLRWFSSTCFFSLSVILLGELFC